MWTPHWLKALQQHQRVYQKPRSGWNTLSPDDESLTFYRLFNLLQQPLHCCVDRGLLPVRIVLFAVAIRLRIMVFEAWASMSLARDLP